MYVCLCQQSVIGLEFSHTTLPKTFYVDVQSTSLYRTFQSEHIQLSKSGCKRSSAAIGASGSIRRRSTEQYHSRPRCIFVRTICFGNFKRSQTKAFLVQWKRVFTCLEGSDGAVVRTLRTEHCFVTCDDVLTFFAVPKTTANYFLWN